MEPPLPPSIAENSLVFSSISTSPLSLFLTFSLVAHAIYLDHPISFLSILSLRLSLSLDLFTFLPLLSLYCRVFVFVCACVCVCVCACM